MRDFVKTAGSLAAALLLLSAAAAGEASAAEEFDASAAEEFDASAAEELDVPAGDDEGDSAAGASDELSRFVPSLALLTHLNAQDAEGHLGTSNVLGPPFNLVPQPPFMSNPNTRSAQPLLPGSPATARTLMMTPAVGVSLELMSPAWRALPGKPRLHLRGDVAYAFPPEYVIPNIGDFGPIRTITVSGLTEGAILGQGGKTTAVVQPLLLNAGAGITFTTTVSERTLRIKTSLEYLREEIEVSGVVQRAARVTQATPDLSAFRVILLSATGSWVYHGLGPGLELELDTGRAGPFVLSLFAGGKAWSFLDNPKRVLVASNEYGEHAEWTFLKNQWAFGGTLGLRFRWVPE